MIIYQRGRFAGREEIILVMCEIIAQVWWAVRDRGEVLLHGAKQSLIFATSTQYEYLLVKIMVIAGLLKGTGILHHV